VPNPALFHCTESPHSIYFPVSTQIQAGGPPHVQSPGTVSRHRQRQRSDETSPLHFPGGKTTSEKNQDEEGSSDLSKESPVFVSVNHIQKPVLLFPAWYSRSSAFCTQACSRVCPLRILKALDGARTRLSPPCDDDRLPRSKPGDPGRRIAVAGSFRCALLRPRLSGRRPRKGG